jgi:hypothetical protein
MENKKRIENFDFDKIKAKSYVEETDSNLWARAFSLGYDLSNEEKEILLKELNQVYSTALSYAIMFSSYENEKDKKIVGIVVPHFVNVDSDLKSHKEVQSEGIGLIVFKQKDVKMNILNVHALFCPEFLLCRFPEQQLHFNYTQTRPVSDKTVKDVLDVSTLFEAIDDIK